MLRVLNGQQETYNIGLSCYKAPTTVIVMKVVFDEVEIHYSSAAGV